MENHFGGIAVKKNFSGKGQATVEFILILLLALAYIISIIQPNADYATTSVQDVLELSKIRLSADKLSNSIQYVSVSGIGTRQSIQLVLPSGSSLGCEPLTGPNSLRFVYTLKSGKGIAACEGDEDPQGTGQPDCNHSVSVGARFSCSPVKIMDAGLYNAIIDKNADGNVNAVFSVVQ